MMLKGGFVERKYPDIYFLSHFNWFSGKKMRFSQNDEHHNEYLLRPIVGSNSGYRWDRTADLD